MWNYIDKIVIETKSPSNPTQRLVPWFRGWTRTTALNEPMESI